MTWSWNGRPYANKNSARVAQWHTFNRDKWYATREASRKRHPERERARKSVWWRIFTRRLAPAKFLPCIDCGDRAVMYDHYLGYEPQYKLAIQAVCQACNTRRRYGRQKEKVLPLKGSKKKQKVSNIKKAKKISGGKIPKKTSRRKITSGKGSSQVAYG